MYAAGPGKSRLQIWCTSVDDGKAQLSRLLDLVRDGAEVIITQHGKTVAKLIRAEDKARKVRLGAMKGEFTYKEGWDKPLTDE